MYGAKRYILDTRFGATNPNRRPKSGADEYNRPSNWTEDWSYHTYIPTTSVPGAKRSMIDVNQSIHQNVLP